MTKIKSLDELLVEELKDLYNTENQPIKTLPRLAQAIISNELRKELEIHLEETKDHARRLENAFKDLGYKPGHVTCKAVKGLIAEGEELVEQALKDAARDAGINDAAQRTEHYEIDTCATPQNHAFMLGHRRVQEFLWRNRNIKRKSGKQNAQRHSGRLFQHKSQPANLTYSGSSRFSMFNKNRNVREKRT